MNSEILSKIINEMVSNICLLEKEISVPNYEMGIINTVTLDKKKYYYYSTRGITPKLKSFLHYIEENSKKICNLELCSDSLEEDYIKRKLAFTWLGMQYNVNLEEQEWNNIFDYIFDISNRTYENLPSSLNLIINLKDKGSVCIKDIKENKILDVLGCSNYTFIEVDTKLHIIKYDCIDVGDVKSKNSYSDIPDYLMPYSQYIENNKNKFAISLSRTGDILVYNGCEIMLTVRKNRWTIYDNASLKNTLLDLVGGFGGKFSYGISCNLYDIVWDISYRRHGALIIVTSGDKADEHIVNKESIISNSKNTDLRYILKSDIEAINISTTGIINKKSLLLELLSADGATLIDISTGGVRAFGSIIESHEDVKNVSGARSTASKSAIRHGHMKPIKISSDGDITLYSKVLDTEGTIHYLEFVFY